MTQYAAPVGYVMQDRESLSVSDFGKLTANGMQFAAFDGATSLIGVRGTCMEPLITSADMLKVRPLAAGEALIDGALYCLASAPGQTSTKLLRYMCKSWYWLCNNAVAELKCDVVAVVVDILKGAAPAPTPPATSTGLNVGNLGPEAAFTLCAQFNNNSVTGPKIAPGTITPGNIAPGAATQPPISTLFTGAVTATATIPSGGKQVMIIELFADSGLGNHGNTGIPTFGGGGASGGYAKSQYAITATNIGQTININLQAASSSPTASTVTSGTFSITTMSVVGGTDGTPGTASVNGNPGTGGPPATGGNLINQMGNDGRIGIASNRGGGAGITGTYGNGNPGGLGTSSNTATNPGGPALCIVTFL